MEYADGMPLSNVAWGQLNADGISQISRLTSLVLDLEYKTPYLDRIQSSDLASHLVRSLSQFATATTTPGSLGTPQTKIIVLIASDVNLTGLAGLFKLDWTLPGYQADSCAPGGAIVFQLRQSQSTKAYIVRASYIAQGLDQLRNQTALTLSTPPEIAPVFIPGCSINNATFDCPLTTFMNVANEAIDTHSANLVN
jgi:4-phytase/acid phosphatase